MLELVELIRSGRSRVQTNWHESSAFIDELKSADFGSRLKHISVLQIDRLKLGGSYRKKRMVGFKRLRKGCG